MPTANFCFRGACISNIHLHASRNLCNPFSFPYPFTLLNYANKSILNLSFQNICSLCRLKFLKDCLHDSDCHLAKIIQNCFGYTRMFETSRFINQNKVNSRRFFGIPTAGCLFNNDFQGITQQTFLVFQDVFRVTIFRLPRCLHKTSSRRVQDVFKTYSKTSSRRLQQDWTNSLLRARFFGHAKTGRTKSNSMCTSDRETTRNIHFCSFLPK